MGNRLGGITILTIDGRRYMIRGNVTSNIGQPKREAIVGLDGVHGYKETPQAPKLSCDMGDSPNINLKDEILNMTSSTVQVELPNGKIHMYEEAFYDGDGNVESEDGKLDFSISAIRADEVLS